MNDKILKLIFDYSKKGRYVDEEFVECLFNIIIKEKKLQKYAKEVHFDKSKKYLDKKVSLASYDCNSKFIRVCMECIKETVESQGEQYSVLFSKIEKIFFKNLKVTELIMHELEHAEQYKIIDTEVGIESGVLKCCYEKLIDEQIIKQMLSRGYSKKQIEAFSKVSMQIQKMHYAKNYMYAPHERLAEIKTYQQIIELLKPIADYIPNLLEFINANKLENLLRGYKDKGGYVASPTIKYLEYKEYECAFEKFGTECKILEQLEWYSGDPAECLEIVQSKYSLLDRMTYGMPISESEFEEERSKLLLTNKYMI